MFVRTALIADIGSNHNQSIDRAKALISTAAKLGFSAVKFQYYKADMLYAPGNIPEDLRKTEIDTTFLKEVRRVCSTLGILLGCSVFHEADVEFLVNEIGVDFLKISSSEFTKKKLIKKAASMKIPLHLSTGGATGKEIIRVVSLTYRREMPTVIYHCCPEYPAPVDHINLRAIGFLNERLPHHVGYSDHSVKIPVILGAVAMGAEYIEIHIDLSDAAGWESKHGHCWTPSQAKVLMETLETLEAAMSFYHPRDEVRKMRSDPEDGMRPYKELRK